MHSGTVGNDAPRFVRRVLHYLLLAAILLGTPLVFAIAGGRQDLIDGLLVFPPRTEDWGADPSKLWNERCPFSLAVFCGVLVFGMLTCGPFVRRLLRGPARRGGASGGASGGKQARRVPRFPFPWFGRAGLLLVTGAWILAWNRFAWFAPFQPHTYLFLWGGYIFVVNALDVRFSGSCPLVARPCAYAALFPASAAFWWFFEYLNRYVWNWYYLGVGHMGAGEYFLFATCSFSTVLPAVVATASLLENFAPFTDARLCGMVRWRARSRLSLAAMASGALAGLGGIVVYPQFAYPLLWISPLLVFLVIRIVSGGRTVLDVLETGDWRLPVRFAVAALLCGFFWEMWNWHSFAKWVYAVPWVHGFQVFEMPLPGFLGYLPFGIECAAVAAWLNPSGFRCSPRTGPDR
ncbi:MAG: hypothetical protein LBK99_12555 [Opitutaceae bacterium]|nr:hypothetical protein [Opitutaceae bacterium]